MKIQNIANAHFPPELFILLALNRYRNWLHPNPLFESIQSWYVCVRTLSKRSLIYPPFVEYHIPKHKQNDILFILMIWALWLISHRAKRFQFAKFGINTKKGIILMRLKISSPRTFDWLIISEYIVYRKKTIRMMVKLTVIRLSSSSR